MRLNLALSVLSASFFAAMDALPPRENPLPTSVDDTGGQASGLEPSRIDGDERNSGGNAEGGVMLLNGFQKLADMTKNRISSIVSKLLNKKVRTWSGLSPATLDNLVVHIAIMQSYEELARKGVSEAKMVSKLMTRHTDEGVASWISALDDLNSEEAKSIAARLQASHAQKLAKDAFVTLGLHKGARKKKKISFYSEYKWRFGDPKFADWKARVEQIDKRDPAMTIVKTLAHYLGDKHLVHALIQAKLNHEEMIAEFQTALLRFWVRRKVDPDDVTAWLRGASGIFVSKQEELKDRYRAVSSWRGLDVATQDTLFQHEKVMRSYMMLDAEGISGNRMLAELIDRYSDEEVARTLNAVTRVKNEPLRKGAERLLDLQFTEWDRNRHEHPPDYVFKLLKLHELSSGSDNVRTGIGEAESLYYNPNFKLWEKYLKRITGGDSEKVIAEMKETMLRVFGEGMLRWLLDAAVEGDEGMKEIAAKFEAAQVKQ